MARLGSSRWTRIVAGLTLVVAGAAIFVAHPGIALAHHVTITEHAACDGWSTQAVYIGGPGDRKIVVDVTINGDHIFQELYFDLAPGHLGHVDTYLLFDRSGTGSLTTSGSVIMYDMVNGDYTAVVDSDFTNINLVCATATPTVTPPTQTPVPPSATPTFTATATVHDQGTTTPLPTDTPAPAPSSTPAGTNTPAPTTTATVVTTDGTTTPISTNTAVVTNTPQSTNTPATPATATPQPPRSSSTPAIGTTPTLTSSVRGIVPPGQPSGGASPRQPTGQAFPATGTGTPSRGGLLSGLLGAMTAALGLIVVATGIRRREI